MKQSNDGELLAEYALNGAEAPFAELLSRYIGLVYSAALRLLGDAHLAEDLTQEVFITLADQAGKLTKHPALAAWLHLTTRNLAVKKIRTDARRRVREAETIAMDANSEDGCADQWESIAPHLDGLIGELNEPDRHALFLRFFQKKSAAEMGADLGLSAEAAQKRVNRAVERLRNLFMKLGITTGASAFSAALDAHAVQAAPVALAQSIAAKLANATPPTKATASPEPHRRRTSAELTALAAATIAVLFCFWFLRTTYAKRAVPPDPGATVQGAWQAPVPARLGEPPTVAEQTALLADAAAPAAVQRFPTESWLFRGYDSPENTLITFQWAKSRGYIEAAQATATPRVQRELDEFYLQGKTDDEVSAMLIESARAHPAFEILENHSLAKDRAMLVVHYDGMPPDAVSIIVFKNFDNQWKISAVEERPTRNPPDSP